MYNYVGSLSNQPIHFTLRDYDGRVVDGIEFITRNVTLHIRDADVSVFQTIPFFSQARRGQFSMPVSTFNVIYKNMFSFMPHPNFKSYSQFQSNQTGNDSSTILQNTVRLQIIIVCCSLRNKINDIFSQQFYMYTFRNSTIHMNHPKNFQA